MLPIPKHLQESLRKLEQHYLSLKEDYTDKLQLVKTQLFHVDSLLSGTIPPPPNLAQNIQELQEYYRCVESELVSLELEISGQLSHVEALVGLEGETKTINLHLGNDSTALGNNQLSASAPQQSLKSEPEPEPESESGLEPRDCSSYANAARLPHPLEEEPSPEPEPSSEIPNTYSVQSFIKTLHVASQNALKVYTRNGGGIHITEIDGIPTLQITVHEEYKKSLQPKISSYTKYFNQWLGSNGKIMVLTKPSVTTGATTVPTQSEVGLLPEYEKLTLMEAIAQLLKNHQGTILHIDFIVRSIYGTMSRDDTNRITKNILQILNDGVKNGDWDVDPDNPNCYTLNYLSIIS